MEWGLGAGSAAGRVGRPGLALSPQFGPLGSKFGLVGRDTAAYRGGMTTETARVATATSREGAGLEDLSRAADSVVTRSGAEIRPETPQSTVVWKVYAALTALAVAFLVAVLLMATGVVGTPHT